MAEVFHARRLGPDGFSKDVVVKRMLPVQSDLRALYENYFRAEARLAAKLPHPNITQVLDYYVEGGVEHLVLELVDGCDVAALIDKTGGDGSLSADVIAYIAASALRGLHFAHEARIDGIDAQLIHRDVSPHNILLSRAGCVKLSDFGVAKARLPWREQTAGNPFRGKIAYAAPESFNEAATIDRRVDIFAMGVVLWEMLTGSTPYPIGNAGIMAKQLGDIPDLLALAPLVPPALVAVITKMLSPDREARYATAADARAAILHAVPDALAAEEKLAALVDRHSPPLLVNAPIIVTPTAIADAITAKAPPETRHPGAIPILDLAAAPTKRAVDLDPDPVPALHHVPARAARSLMTIAAAITLTVAAIGLTTTMLYRNRQAGAFAAPASGPASVSVTGPTPSAHPTPSTTPTPTLTAVASPSSTTSAPAPTRSKSQSRHSSSSSAARETGDIIVAEVAGCEVSVDGIHIGPAPQRYAISPGYHSVTLNLADGRAKTERVLIEAKRAAWVSP